VRPFTASLVVTCVLVLAACGDDGSDEPAPATTSSVAEEAVDTTVADDPSDVEDVSDSQDGDDDRSDDDPADDDGGEPVETPEDDADNRPHSAEEVITAVFTDAGSPEEACDELVTDSFVRDAYGAPQGCRAARAPQALASRVEVSKLRESGDQATAIVTPDGGVYDGIEVDVTLIADPEQPDSWLLDSLVADVPAGP
jgi:hypothetical protein